MASKVTMTEAVPNRFGREEPYDFTELDRLLDADYAPTACRCIHIGCGNGRVTVNLARRGYRVLGIDPDRDLLASARERAAMIGVEIELMAGDPLALPPLPEECYGLALDYWTAGALEDGPEREDYLRRILRLLRRGGVLVASSAIRKGAAGRSRKRLFAFAGPFVSDFTRAGFEVVFEGIQDLPSGESRLVVHAQKPI